MMTANPREGSGSDRSRMVIRRRSGLKILNVEDIRWLEARRDYVTVHGAEGTIVVRSTMKDFENRLSPFRFVRIHRSAIVNLGQLAEIRIRGTTYDVVLRCGTTIAVGKRRKKYLRSLLESQHHCFQAEERDRVSAHRAVTPAQL